MTMKVHRDTQFTTTTSWGCAPQSQNFLGLNENMLCRGIAQNQPRGWGEIQLWIYSNIGKDDGTLVSFDVGGWVVVDLHKHQCWQASTKLGDERIWRRRWEPSVSEQTGRVCFPESLPWDEWLYAVLNSITFSDRASSKNRVCQDKQKLWFWAFLVMFIKSE